MQHSYNFNLNLSIKTCCYRNPGTKTVEECLLKALKDAEMITEDQFLRPQLMYFQRAARTDKSVSAIRQTISLKILESIKDKVSDINRLLPDDIRLMGCKRVTQAFDAKNYCDARTYSYLMPSFTLCPVSEVTREDYKVSPETLKAFNSILEGYLGTHNFHNFTSGKPFADDSSVRVIKSIECSAAFYPCNQNKIEFVVVRVKGQSFMMHQIRKMIGLAIAVAKGFATMDHIKRSMEEPFMDVPKAPGLGLMLEEVHFDRYNRKFGGDGHHEPIEWGEHNKEIRDFMEKHIYSVVVETEIKDRSMFQWLNTLSLHSYGSHRTVIARNNSEEKISTLSKLSGQVLETGKEANEKLDDKDKKEEEPDRKRQKIDSN